MIHTPDSGLLRGLLIALVLLICAALPATLVINENIQGWTAHGSYGNYTQTITAGTINLTQCVVSPGASANGEGSLGRVQMAASSGIIEFPQLSSAGTMEFVFAAGSTGRSVSLQYQSGANWIGLIIFNGIGSTGSRFSFQVNMTTPVKLRLANPSHALYVHDIFATDFQGNALPELSLQEPTNITYSGALAKAFVEASGTSMITTRGFCWSTTPNPLISDNQVTTGSGISPMQTTLTGMQPDTQYYLRAYAQNGSGVAYSNEFSFTTASIGSPTVQTSMLEFYPGSTSVQLSWAPGNGSRRLIKINTSNTFTLPQDGMDYPPNPAYSGTGEQVIYFGATQIIEGEPVNTVSVTGLQRNTLYWFRAFEANGTGANTSYLTTTTAFNPASCTTLDTGLQGYYDDITGYGSTLKTNLHNLLRETHLTQFAYSALWQQLQYTDEDTLNTNNVIQTYTGWSVPKGYYGTGATQWNREHTWSVSHGGFETNRPAGTDLHHVRPCDVTVNSAKGNKDFDEGGTPYVDASPYPGYSGDTGCNTAPSFWEPRDIEKGDVARMILYMAVRYEGTDTTYDLELQDTTPTTGPFYGKFSTLLSWHEQDPPDAWERRRNDRIQERQGNRNPFIDRPEFVAQLWYPHATTGFSETEDYFTAAWTHSPGAQSYRVDVSSSPDFTTYLYQEIDTGYVSDYEFHVPDQDFVYFRVKAFLGSGYTGYSNTMYVNLANIPAIELSYFTATSTPHGFVRVNWETAQENNLMGFRIYRSTDSELSNALQVSTNLIPATNTNQPQQYFFDDWSLTSDGYFYYWLEATEVAGFSHYFGPVMLWHTVDNSDPLPAVLAFTSTAWPNPFSATTAIKYDIPDATHLTLSIYNARGQVVRKLVSEAKTPGTYQTTWDGRDEQGRNLAPGVYLYRLQTDKQALTRKLLLK